MLESFPHDSHHKFELPAQNLLPPIPKAAGAHLKQISDQLFALCYSVEDFVNRSRKDWLPDIDPEVWNFFHEVIKLLPRTLEKKDIKEARIDLYQALYKTERVKPVSVTELINPGADIPEPLLMQTEADADDAEDCEASGPTEVEIDAIPESNPSIGNLAFSLTQNAIVATDGVEYTVEFIPDLADEGEETEAGPEEGQEEADADVEPAVKGKGKGAAVASKAPVVKKATRAKKKAAGKKEKVAAAEKTARAASTRRSAKARAVSASSPSPAPTKARKAPAKVAPAPGPASKKRGRVEDADDDDADGSPVQKKVRRVKAKEPEPPVAASRKSTRKTRSQQ